MTEKLAEFYETKPEPLRGCLFALRDTLLRFSPNITETVKYGMPCFCLDTKAFTYLWVDKHTKEPYILFVDGQHLSHPSLESGDRARMKILRVVASEDLPVETIHEALQEAIVLRRA